MLGKLEDSLVTKAGFIGGLFHTWRCEVILTREYRKFGVQLEDLEKKRFQEKHAQFDVVFAQWVKGNAAGLLDSVLHLWGTFTEKNKKHRRQRQRIEWVLRQVFEGERRGQLDTAFHSWLKDLNHAKATGEFHSHLASHRDALSKYEAASGYAILKWMDDGDQALLHLCLVYWIRVHQHEVVHEAALAHYKGRVEDLELLLEQHTADKKTRLLKYFAELVDTSTSEYITMVFAQWKLHAHQAQSAETHRQLEVQLNEQQRMHDAAVARHKEAQLFSIEMMGFKFDAKHVLMKYFFAWSTSTHQSQQMWQHKLNQNRALTKYSEYIMRSFVTKTDEQILSICFQEFVLEYHHQKQLRHNAMMVELDELRAHHDKFGAWQLEWEQERQMLLERLEGMEQQRRAEKLRKIAQFDIVFGQWAKGKTAGLLKGVVLNWGDLMRTNKKHRIQRNRIEWVLRTVFEGEKRGNLDMAFQSWLKDLHHAKVTGEFHGHLASNMLAAKQKHKAAVGVAMLRFVEQSDRALLHLTMLHWHEVVHHEALVQFQSRAEDLEGMLEQHTADKKKRLLKYFAELVDAGTSEYLTMVFAQWKLHSHQAASAEGMRQLEVQLEEQQQLHDAAVARHKEVQLSSIEMMGFKLDAKHTLMKFINAWSSAMHQEHALWQERLAHNEVLTKYSEHIMRSFATKSNEQLLSLCFQEFDRERHLQRQLRHNQAQAELDELRTHTENFDAWQLEWEQERQTLLEKLEASYKQLDSVTDTLQKELKTKEELTGELRNANSLMRQANIETLSEPRMSRLVTPSGRSMSLGTATPPMGTPRKWSFSDSHTLNNLTPRGGRGGTSTPRANTSGTRSGTTSPLGSAPAVGWFSAVEGLRDEGILRAAAPRV